MVDDVKKREDEEEEEEEEDWRKKRKHGADTASAGKRQLHNGCQATTKARAWQELAAMLRK